MKKITTALAMMALTVTLSTMAFGQNGKRNQHVMQSSSTLGRQATRTGNNTGSSVVYVGGSQRQRNNAPQRSSVGEGGSKSIESFNFGSIQGAKAQRQSRAASPNNLTINGGAGNDKPRSDVASSN